MISETLLDLQQQAIDAGGDVAIIAGNHDDSFLIAYSRYENTTNHQASQSRVSNHDDVSFIDRMFNGMPRDQVDLPLGLMQHTQLVSVVNGTLYSHTPPSEGMLALLAT